MTKQNKFAACLDTMAQSANAEYSAAFKELGPETRPGSRGDRGPRLAIEAMERSDLYRKLQNKLRWIARLREHTPMVDAGFLSAADVFKMCGFDATMTKAAKIVAEPGNTRIHRERCAEINEENDARAFGERMGGLGEGSLGRTLEARSDSIDMSMFFDKHGNRF